MTRVLQVIVNRDGSLDSVNGDTTDVNKLLEKGWELVNLTSNSFSTEEKSKILFTYILNSKEKLSQDKLSAIRAAESLSAMQTFGSESIANREFDYSQFMQAALHSQN